MRRSNFDLETLIERMMGEVVENTDEPSFGEGQAARGNNDKKSPFKLLRPGSNVIAEDQPVFEWQAVEGASNFEVQIADSRGHEVAKSSRLPASVTQWSPVTPLRRGVIYSWAVSAIVNGQPVTSPAPTAPEMKFKILEASKMRQLEQLRGRGFSHLALGVFYAREGSPCGGTA